MAVHYRKPIVVGIDGSHSAVEAARWAAVQAERREVPLRLVHAYEMPLGAPTGATVEDSILNTTRDQGRQWLGEARAAVAEVIPQLLPETVLEAASVVAALKLESRTATMLVLGTRGRCCGPPRTRNSSSSAAEAEGSCGAWCSARQADGCSAKQAARSRWRGTRNEPDRDSQENGDALPRRPLWRRRCLSGSC